MVQGDVPRTYMTAHSNKVGTSSTKTALLLCTLLYDTGAAVYQYVTSNMLNDMHPLVVDGECRILAHLQTQETTGRGGIEPLPMRNQRSQKQFVSWSQRHSTVHWFNIPY